MPIIKSAKKALRSGARKRVTNDKRRRAMKENIKEIRALSSAKNQKEAEKLLSQAFQAIDKAAKRGVIKKNNAARKKSRLVKLVRKIK